MSRDPLDYDVVIVEKGAGGHINQSRTSCNTPSLPHSQRTLRINCTSSRARGVLVFIPTNLLIQFSGREREIYKPYALLNRHILPHPSHKNNCWPRTNSSTDDSNRFSVYAGPPVGALPLVRC
jgi:hypothetical protein